jgi:hypothetical protein
MACTQTAPSKYQNWLSSVSYTIKPVAGVEIPVRCELFILGTRNPLSVALRSKTALGSGDEVPIPMLSCAKPATDNIPENSIVRSKAFLISFQI